MKKLRTKKNLVGRMSKFSLVEISCLIKRAQEWKIEEKMNRSFKLHKLNFFPTFLRRRIDCPWRYCKSLTHFAINVRIASRDLFHTVIQEVQPASQATKKSATRSSQGLSKKEQTCGLCRTCQCEPDRRDASHYFCHVPRPKKCHR